MKKRYAIVNSKGSFKALIEIDEGEVTIHTAKAFRMRPIENWAYEMYIGAGFKKEAL